MTRSGRRRLPQGWSSYPPSATAGRPWETADYSASKPPLRRDAAGRAVISLIPEYGAGLPLWDQDWRALDLDPSLLSALADWQQQFQDHFHPSKGWTNGAIRDAWAAAAEELVGRLQRALPPGVELVVDLWPLSGR